MSKINFNKMGFPEEFGLYDPKNEHENCGFGFIANIKNEPKHEIVHQALEIVHNLDHRGAVGADPKAGDGSGLLIQIPHKFLKKKVESDFNLPDVGQYAVGVIFMPKEKNNQDKINLLFDKIKTSGFFSTI